MQINPPPPDSRDPFPMEYHMVTSEFALTIVEFGYKRLLKKTVAAKRIASHDSSSKFLTRGKL